MFDVSMVVGWMGGVGVLTFGQQTFKYVRDERRKKIENARADAQAPLTERSLIIDNADKWTGIQTRLITTLNAQVEDMGRGMAEKDALIAQLRQEKVADQAQIRELYATIGELESSHRKHPPGRGRQP